MDSLCARLLRGSETSQWRLSDLPWVERLDPDACLFPPEWISLAGTPAWDALSAQARNRLALTELASFFSLTLHGERPLISGLAARLFDGRTPILTSRYLHVFLDEEARHIAMFGEFASRYHRIYPWKKLAVGPADDSPEAAEVKFLVRTLVVEEIGLHVNAVLARDERLPPLVREINRLHHRDELRHVAFGRRALVEAGRQLPDHARPDMRRWIATYVRQSWADYANAEAYADAGVPEPHEVRAQVLASAAFRERMATASTALFSALRGAELWE
jgi:hypothetical protein